MKQVLGQLRYRNFDLIMLKIIAIIKFEVTSKVLRKETIIIEGFTP